MKWKNAVELPNNPYSAEALQRRLSQTQSTKCTDIERLAGRFESNDSSHLELEQTSAIKAKKTIKIVPGNINPER